MRESIPLQVEVQGMLLSCNGTPVVKSLWTLTQRAMKRHKEKSMFAVTLLQPHARLPPVCVPERGRSGLTACNR